MSPSPLSHDLFFFLSLAKIVERENSTGDFPNENRKLEKKYSNDGHEFLPTWRTWYLAVHIIRQATHPCWCKHIRTTDSLGHLSDDINNKQLTIANKIRAAELEKNKMLT